MAAEKGKLTVEITLHPPWINPMFGIRMRGGWRARVLNPRAVGRPIVRSGFHETKEGAVGEIAATFPGLLVQTVDGKITARAGA